MAADGLSDDFAVVVGFADEEATIVSWGAIDLLAARELGAFLDAAIVSGSSSVVLELDDLEAIDAAGVSVIAAAGHRLAAVGGQLTIRSPSAIVCRLLGFTGLSTAARIEQPVPSRDRLLAEESVALSPSSVGTELSSLTQHLRQVTAITADSDVVDGALRLVASLAHAAVHGADGASVTLRRDGRLSTVAASNETVAHMDADQYATGEGPCIDASVEGRRFHVESLASETRWPAFTPRAQALGINSILSSPLLAGGQAVGALNIYSRARAAFAPRDQQLASLFASEASSILTDAGVDVPDDQLATRLEEALRARRIIAQAEGVVMEREGISGDEAYDLLRRFSLAAGRPLRVQAEEVVDSTQAFQPEIGAQPPPGRLS